LIAAFFEEVLDEFKRCFQAHRVALDMAHEVLQEDEAGNFFLAPLADTRPPESIKDLAESFEAQHPLGRLIDIDILDRHVQPVSSGRLKQCLLCEKPAIVCMREANHGYEELREHIAAGIRRYLAEKKRKYTCRRLAALALKAVLYEVSASPKPASSAASSAARTTTWIISPLSIPRRPSPGISRNWRYRASTLRARISAKRCLPSAPSA
jgi:holo-ACP synthase/triphosphoribosyl-dephospho-CoA synthase